MKKTYINPEMEVIKIQTQQMLAASLGMYEDTVTDETEVLGREFDDDWE